jgi:hypothetical protein
LHDSGQTFRDHVVDIHKNDLDTRIYPEFYFYGYSGAYTSELFSKDLHANTSQWGPKIGIFI